MVTCMTTNLYCRLFWVELKLIVFDNYIDNLIHNMIKILALTLIQSVTGFGKGVFHMHPIYHHNFRLKTAIALKFGQ